MADNNRGRDIGKLRQVKTPEQKDAAKERRLMFERRDVLKKLEPFISEHSALCPPSARLGHFNVIV